MQKTKRDKPYLFKTTIQVTKSMLKTYNRMVNRYSVTTAVSAGIAILNSLEPAERETWVDKINEMAAADKLDYEKAITQSAAGDDQLAESAATSALKSEKEKRRKKSGTVPKSA